VPRPFPGMDPYLETQGMWESFHAALVTHCAEELNQGLPEGYVAQIETRVNLISRDVPERQRIPDVLAGRETDAPASPLTSSGRVVGVVTIEPMTIPLANREVERRERWIEISSLPELELVTVVEVLSPSNKAGRGRTEYLLKRDALIDRPVSLVEVELLLGGERMPMDGDLPPGDYFAIVARSSQRPNAQVYAWTIRQPLPPIPIPLRMPDADVMLNLGEAFDATYNRGRYGRLVRHGSPLPESLAIAPADRDRAEGRGR
jgi:hypothetical protein